MSSDTKLAFNSARPERIRIAELEKAVDKLRVSVHQMQKTIDEQARQLADASREIATLRAGKASQ